MTKLRHSIFCLTLLTAPAWADTTIGNLPSGGAVQAGDGVPATRAGSPVKVILGTAASKAASGGGTTVSSVTGSTTVGHIATFSDTTGTLTDGGVIPGASPLIGIAGGDLSGSFPNPTVTKIGGQTPATVAITGAYGDLSGKPTLATVANSGSYLDLANKPTIPTALPPSGTAGGDLSGSFPNPTVATINGQAPAASATTDTTNASNIGSGTLSGARLPAPTVTILGGIKAMAAAAHKFLTGVDTSGNPTFAQPAASDITGLATVATSGSYADLASKPTTFPPSGTASGDLTGSFPNPTVAKINGLTPSTVATSGNYGDLSGKPALSPSATIDTTNAANISSGTLGSARLPSPTATALGGVQATAPAAHNFLTGITTGGVPQAAQPAASDVTGLATVATTGSYSDLSNKPTGLPATGAASGDLSGSFPSPTVAKINGQAPAAVATSGAYADLTGKPALATVATSGSYADLVAKPTIPTTLPPSGSATGDLAGSYPAPSVVRINGQVPATVATSGSYPDLLNRPTLGTASSHAATDFLTPTSTLIATGTTAARALSDHFADTKRAQDFNVKCDGTKLYDITATASSAVISSASYQFSSTDVGKSIEVTDELETTGISTTIASVSGGNATLAASWTSSSISKTARATFYITDDTAAINAGLAASVTPDASGNNMVGFRFVLPGRVCIASTVIQPRMSHIEFEGGPQSGILHRKWGTNAPLLKSENFDALTLSGLSMGNGTMTNTSQAVPYYYGFTAHLDCNKAGNTASNCVSYYGNARRIGTGSLVENSSGDGIYLEKTGDHACSATDWRMKEEDMIGDIMVRNNAGYAVRNRSNDSYVENLISYNNAGNWINETSAATVTSCDGTTSVPKYNGGMHFNHFHPYTATNGINADFGSPTSLNYFYNDYGRAIIRDHLNVPYNQTTACGYLGLPCYDIQSTASYDQIGQVDLSMKAGQSVSPAAFNIPSGAGPVITQILGSSVAPGANSTAVKVRNSFDRVSGGISNFSASGSIGADLGGSFNYFAFNGFGNATHFAYTPGHHNIGLFQCYTGGVAGACGTIAPAATDDFTILSDDPSTPSAHYVPALYVGGNGTAAAPAISWSGDKSTGFHHGGTGETDVDSSGGQVAKFTSSGLTLNAMTTAGVVTNSASGVLGSSATLPSSMLPTPSPSTLGGVNSIAAVAHQFLTGISTAGLPAQAQPAFADLAGSLAAAQFPAVTGDIAIAAGSTTATLPTVNGNAGTFNNLTVNAKGLVTAASNVSYLTSQYYTWTVQTASAPLANGIAYVTNGGTQLNDPLPATCTPGDHYRIAGMGAGGWQISQNAGQSIQFGGVSTTTGTAGSLVSQVPSNGAEIVCIVANTNFLVVASQGKLTVN